MTNAPVEIKKTAAPAANQNAAGSWHSFRQDVERLFDRAASVFEMPSLRTFGNIEHLWPQSFGNMQSFAVDVSEDGKAYTVTAELPGMDEKDVEVTLGDDYVTIKGEKRQEKEDKRDNHYIRERSYGAFQRTFALPGNVNPKTVEAKFGKGVLIVTLPKTADAQDHKKIEVKAA